MHRQFEPVRQGFCLLVGRMIIEGSNLKMPTRKDRYREGKVSERMKQRISYFEKLKSGFDEIDGNAPEPAPGEGVERGEEAGMPVRKEEYIPRMKSRLNAWTSEFNKLESKTSGTILDEDCRYEIEKLDCLLSEGYEKLRNLMEITDDSWDRIRKEADSLWADILSLFEIFLPRTRRP